MYPWIESILYEIENKALTWLGRGLGIHVRALLSIWYKMDSIQGYIERKEKFFFKSLPLNN